MNHVYGPVSSRRLGSSLGVDIIPPGTCTFDCVYCQLGRTTHLVSSAAEVNAPFPGIDDILASVRDALDANDDVDYITMSGRGEPMLSPHLDDIMDGIQALTDVPLAIITNGSLLVHSEVRETASRFDLVVPSLDAAMDDGLVRINRPAPGFRTAEIIEGIAEVARTPAKVWLEIMFVESDHGLMNTDLDSVTALVRAARRISPDRIDINTCIRPPAEQHVHPLSRRRLEIIASWFRGAGLQVLVVPEEPAGALCEGRVAMERVASLLRVRPCTMDELSCALGCHPLETGKLLHRLQVAATIEPIGFGGKVYFRKTSLPSSETSRQPKKEG